MARGAVLGGLCIVVGALAGCNQTGTTAVGGAPSTAVAALAGEGLVGGAIGRELDRASLRAAAEAEHRALEFGRTGTPVSWRRGTNSGEVVPGAQYQVNTFNCRDYVHTIHVNGQTQSARGTACRQPNGAWQQVT